MRKKKFLALLLLLAVVFSCIGSRSVAKAEDNFVTMVAGTPTLYNMNPGETVHFKIPVRLGSYNYGITNSNSIAVMVESPDGIFDTADAVLTRDNTAEGSAIGLSPYYDSNVEFDLALKDTVKIGTYTAEIDFKFSGYDYSTMAEINSAKLSFTIRVRTEKAPAQLTVDSFHYNEAAAAVGSTFDIGFDVKNEGEIAALNTYVSIGYSDGIVPNYTVESVKVGDLAAGQKKSQAFSVRVLPDAAPGVKTLTIQYTYKDAEGKSYTEDRTVYVNILAASTAPSDDARLTVKSTMLNPEVNVDTKYELTLELENIGKETAKNIVVLIPENGGIGADTGILPAYDTTGVSLNSLAAGEKKNVTLPISITKNASAGLKELGVNISYEDSDGNMQTTVGKVYITILPEKQTEEVKNDVVISNMTQSPAQPVAGEVLTITFDITNNGNNDVSDIMLYGEDLSSSTFEPLSADVKMAVGGLAQGESRKVTMNFRVGSNIPEGMNELKLAADYVDANGTSQKENTTVYILNVKKVTLENDVVISNLAQTPEQPVAGEVLKVSFDIKNNGNWDISNLILYGEELSSSSFEPLAADIKTTVGDLAAGESKAVTMEFRVGSNISEGMNELKLAAAYVDANGASQKESTSVYILNVKQVTKEQIKNSISIGNISQSPASPVVGENVSISFTVTNNGTKEITDLKFAGANLGSNSFEPVSSEVYTEAGTIPAGGSKNVSMTFKVGSGIPEGFNQLSLAYSYTDGNGDSQAGDTAVYILDVKNESSINTSRPKLIVSDFATDSEELRAGTTFNFTFKLKNTHTVKAAKNIKVTITQDQDIFSATQGSNSFYIDAINPGEEAENTINLKVKSDTATGAYEVKIAVEYEYDDMSQTDATNGGVKDENLIKLQAVENARPTVQNLSVGYGWDTPTVNQSTSLMFYFYNMGKSTLDNVYVTIDGDFQMESGTMSIIGSVGAGSSSYQEISIIPTIEGMAKGTLVIHFEDSNGDEVTKEFEIPETYIQGEYVYDYNPGDWSDPGYNVGGDVVEAKKPLMPVWAYVLCLVAALGLGTLISRTAVIKLHKKKLMDAEDI